MSKLPVRATVGHAYGFFFRNFGRVLGVVFVPIAILMTIGYFLGRWQIEQSLAIVDIPPDPGTSRLDAAGIFFGQAVTMNVIDAVFVSIAAVGLHRLVLFGERAPAIRPGLVEIRFIGFAAVVAIAWVALNTLYFFGLIASIAKEPVSAFGLVAVQLVALILGLRFLLVFPAIVAEGRISLGRAWILSRGNFWRLLAVNFLGATPVFCLIIFVSLTIMPKPPMEFVFVEGPEAQRRLLQWSLDNLPLTQAVNGLLHMVSIALGVIVLSYVYKKVAGHDHDAQLTPPGD